MTIKELQIISNEDNVRAFLDTISFTEGAGYNTLFSGRTFKGFEDHPRIKITSGNYTSTAAGRYQILEKTWNEIQTSLHLPNFSPESQDIAAVWLINRRGVLSSLRSGDISKVLDKCSYEWASLPPKRYNQPVKDKETVVNYWNSKKKVQYNPLKECNM